MNIILQKLSLYKSSTSASTEFLLKFLILKSTHCKEFLNEISHNSLILQNSIQNELTTLKITKKFIINLFFFF